MLSVVANVVAAYCGVGAASPGGSAHGDTGNASNHECHVGTKPVDRRCTREEVHQELGALRYSESAQQNGRRAGAQTSGDERPDG
jgi:hypothetical protein